ncbi:MAG TPA: MBL fold metallo-hydrolase, partial [Caldilineae bacterium]|nr:MBL fold metallo-hydrolase [Caldilineae bacterium]
MTELIFLGVGAIIPTVAGDHTAFLLRHGGKTILFDAGPALEVQLDRVGVAPTEIDHAYFSHQHGDHTLGSPMLLFHHRSRRYLAAPPVLAAWRQMVEIVYPGYLALIPDQVLYHDLAVGVANPWPDLPDVTARIAPVDHSGLQAYALRLDFAPAARPGFSLVYSGDTCPTASVVELARDADLLIHEATFSETLEQVGGPMHTSARQAGEIAQKAGV